MATLEDAISSPLICDVYGEVLIQDMMVRINDNTTFVSETDAQTQANLQSAITNSTNISINAADIATNVTDIAANTALIEENMHIVDLLSDLAGVDTDKYTQILVSSGYVEGDSAGGIFIYDDSKSSDNDGGIVLDGWVRQYTSLIQAEWFGVKYDGEDDTVALHRAQDAGLTEINDDIVCTTAYEYPLGHDMYGYPTPALVSFNNSLITGLVSVEKTQVLNIANSKTQGNFGKEHNLIAGGIQRLDSGDAWSFMSDSDGPFAPLNIDFTQGLGDSGISLIGGGEGEDLQIFYKGNILNSMTVTPDEVYSNKGITCGNESDGDSTIISFSAPCSFNIGVLDTDPILTSLDEDLWGPTLGNARFDVDVNATSGKITLKHPASAVEGSVSKAVYIPNHVGDIFSSNYTVVVEQTIDTQTILRLQGMFQGVIDYDVPGTEFIVSDLESHKPTDFSVSYDESTGIMIVTHPETTSNTAPLTIQQKIDDAAGQVLNFSAFGVTSTGFSLKISKTWYEDADSSGSRYTEPENVSFYFNRGLTAIVDQTKMTGTIKIDTGIAKVYAGILSNATGNFWINGTTQQ